MRVLIVGGYGYVGVALTRHLAAAGHEVMVAGRPPRPSVADAVHAALDDARRNEVIEVAGGEIQDAAPIAEAIVHLAGGGAPNGNLTDAAASLRDNVESAARVAEIAPKGARLILASSIYVYGTGPRPFRETDTLCPDTLYGQLKAVAEAVWRQRGGTSLRFAHIYGVGSGVDFGRDGVTERLARAAAGGEPFVMHGDGSQRLDLVHIDDACEAVALALRAPELPSAVNIGDGDPISVADLSRIFAAHRPDDPCWKCRLAARIRNSALCLRCAAIGPVPNEGRAMDISLAASALGWRPRVSLADGARSLIEHFRRRPCQ